VFEDELFAAAKRGDIQAVVLRISSPLSIDPRQLPGNVIGRWIATAVAGQALKVVGSGNRTQDIVWTEDIAEAMEKAVLLDETGLFNIASGQPVRMIDLARQIADRFRVETVVGVETDPNENERWNISIERAGRKLGYVPRWNGLTALAE